ncbi:DUF305 domain-containing protein [Massilia terrae]|uniref:DUF305 domain-containing protein n=2 Tax=Massilia terrae TaxID=1811224 RepID=A0ABT2CTU3_9BURK|nr:DUF305 domain-containing protein [Massilia terrae]MCS0656528.1 DUF305 domain-containing protein [Massilia terrae]
MAQGQPAAHQHGQGSATPATFVASSAKPYDQLANEAMAIMDRGMRSAPMDGVPDHDFVAMMVPHHQGAIDMAKAILVHSKDQELRNLAQGIITEQQNEINVMRAWLRRYQAAHSRAAPAAQTPTDKDSHAHH